MSSSNDDRSDSGVPETSTSLDDGQATSQHKRRRTESPTPNTTNEPPSNEFSDQVDLTSSNSDISSSPDHEVVPSSQEENYTQQIEELDVEEDYKPEIISVFRELRSRSRSVSKSISSAAPSSSNDDQSRLDLSGWSSLLPNNDGDLELDSEEEVHNISSGSTRHLSESPLSDDKNAANQSRHPKRKRILTSSSSDYDEAASFTSSSRSGRSIDPEELKRVVETCTKLFQEKKITKENAFSLKMLDLISKIIISPDFNSSDLPMVANAIEVVVKIFLCRVEIVYNEIKELVERILKHCRESSQRPPSKRSKTESPPPMNELEDANLDHVSVVDSLALISEFVLKNAREAPNPRQSRLRAGETVLGKEREAEIQMDHDLLHARIKNKLIRDSYEKSSANSSTLGPNFFPLYGNGAIDVEEVRVNREESNRRVLEPINEDIEEDPEYQALFGPPAASSVDNPVALDFFNMDLNIEFDPERHTICGKLKDPNGIPQPSQFVQPMNHIANTEPINDDYDDFHVDSETQGIYNLETQRAGQEQVQEVIPATGQVPVQLIQSLDQAEEIIRKRRRIGSDAEHTFCAGLKQPEEKKKKSKKADFNKPNQKPSCFKPIPNDEDYIPMNYKIGRLESTTIPQEERLNWSQEDNLMPTRPPLRQSSIFGDDDEIFNLEQIMREHREDIQARKDAQKEAEEEEEAEERRQADELANRASPVDEMNQDSSEHQGYVPEFDADEGDDFQNEMIDEAISALDVDFLDFESDASKGNIHQVKELIKNILIQKLELDEDCKPTLSTETQYEFTNLLYDILEYFESEGKDPPSFPIIFFTLLHFTGDAGLDLKGFDDGEDAFSICHGLDWDLIENIPGWVHCGGKLCPEAPSPRSSIDPSD